MHSKLPEQGDNDLRPDPAPAFAPEPPLRSLGRVLRLPELERKVGLKKTQIYGLMAAGQFPLPMKLATRAVGWLEFEVDDWILKRAGSRMTIDDLRNAAIGEG
jgi:prophage regulatory protein